jgi:capsular polysaccharide biosynthesis protein
VALALIRELSDRFVRSGEDLTEALNIPLLGAVASIGGNRKPAISGARA